jgi:peptidoglycan/xylan/chitin deacetylase (PgdA/CDA1 family)
MRIMFRSHDVILLYHRVAVSDSDPWSLCITPERFSEHLEVLRECVPITFQQVNLSDRYGGKRPRVVVTFDDGYADNLYAAKPLLERYGIPATVFVVTGYVGKDREFWWDELEKIVFGPEILPGTIQFTSASGTRCFNTGECSRSSLYMSLYRNLQPMRHEERREILDQLLDGSHQSPSVRESHRIMSTEEVVKLADGGLIEIGAHTVTHPRLSSQPLAIQQMELQNSKSWLESLLGRSIASFSYPFGGSGHYSQETVWAVREAGYVRACTTAAHRVAKGDNLHELPRFNANDMTANDLEKLLFA